MTKNQKIILIFAFLGSLILAFLLGRLSMKTKDPVSSSGVKIITSQDMKKTDIIADITSGVDVEIRGSSRGSKYYFPWCKSNFSEDNTIYFESEDDAISKGYELAAGCLVEPKN